MKLVILLCCSIFVTSCSAPDIVPLVHTQRVTVNIPASLRDSCYISLPPPVGSLQSAVATYILDLNQSLEDCAAKHTGLVEVIDDFTARLAAGKTTQ